MAPSPGGVGPFGLDLRDDPQRGVFVGGVDSGSAAADSVEPGDGIVEVNGAPVKNAREAAAKIGETRAERPLLLKIERSGRALYVAIEHRKEKR
jgi:S1-C subfamily serine protease